MSSQLIFVFVLFIGLSAAVANKASTGMIEGTTSIFSELTPTGFTDSEIETALKSKRDWIYKDDASEPLEDIRTEGNILRSHVATKPADTWPGAFVPYYINPAFSHYQLLSIIQAGIMDIVSKTCVHFQFRGKYDPKIDPLPERGYFLYIDTGSKGCFFDKIPPGGYNRGRGLHYMHLEDPVCMTPAAVTTVLMSVLGFEHKHKRPDRDQHIQIHWGNIKREFVHNFWRDSWLEENSTKNEIICELQATDGFDYSGCVSGNVVNNFGQEYDLKSIQHYAGRAKDKSALVDILLPFITQWSNGKPPKKHNKLSVLDIAWINTAYKCPKKHPDPSCMKHFQLTKEKHTIELTEHEMDKLQNCTVHVTPEYNEVRLETLKFKIVDCRYKIQVYKDNHPDKIDYCARKVPKIIQGKRGITLVFGQIDDHAKFTFKIYLVKKVCCEGTLNAVFKHGSIISSHFQGHYKMNMSAYTSYMGVKYPVYNNHYLWFARATTYTSYPWILGTKYCPNCKPGGTHGVASFGFSKTGCLEDATRVMKKDKLEFASDGLWSITCNEILSHIDCKAPPHPTMANGGTSDWDGSTHLTTIQYTCPDRKTRSYATCMRNGTWGYSVTPACHGDGKPVANATEFCTGTGIVHMHMKPGVTYPVRTPGFPDKYPNNRDCAVYLVAPTKSDRIEVEAKFDISIEGPSPSCENDFMAFDNLVGFPAKNLFCGEIKAPFKHLSGNALLKFFFKSNANVTMHGFEILARVVEV